MSLYHTKTTQFLTALSIIKTTFIDKKQKGASLDTPSLSNLLQLIHQLFDDFRNNTSTYCTATFTDCET